MQFRLFNICTFTLLVFRGSGFNCPTDLGPGTCKWNRAKDFIYVRYVSITDYDRAIFRYLCDTL